jgi:hypothetical protein
VSHLIDLDWEDGMVSKFQSRSVKHRQAIAYHPGGVGFECSPVSFFANANVDGRFLYGNG